MSDKEQELIAAKIRREETRREYDKANIRLQQACIELSDKGYSGYRLAQLTGLTKMTIYKWVKPKTH
jgi:hypothetical protein